MLVGCYSALRMRFFDEIGNFAILPVVSRLFKKQSHQAVTK
jgi:hypothetical protein